MVRSTRRLALLAILILAFAAQAHAASVTVAWDPNPESGVRYVVYWGTRSLTYTSSASAGTSLSYVVTNLSPGQTYYFAVQAVTTSGLTSPYSDEVSATIPTTTPPTGDTAKPALAVTSHTNGQTVTNSSITLSGTASDAGFGDNGIASVVVNGTRASNDTATGSGVASWSRALSLFNGTNSITVTATDASANANATTLTMTITCDCANAPSRPRSGDFTGSGHTDFAVYRRSNSQWLVRGWPNGIAFGAAGDIPVAADFDGDGKMDIAVWRPSDGNWYILLSTGNYALSSERVVQWGYGAYGDIPVPGDYDGDGKADIAIWRASTGDWWILLSSRGYDRSAPLTVQWGHGSLRDVPVPADYDGDGKTDIAVWRQTTGEWYILKSSQGFNRSSATVIQWGNGVLLGDVPLPADYDGDGKADPAVWRPSSGNWFLLKSSENYNRSTYLTVQWGAGVLNDVPVPGDYDGDGKADLAIWRPASGDWWVLNSSDSYNRALGYKTQWGAASVGDVPATGTLPLGSPVFGVIKYR